MLWGAVTPLPVAAPIDRLRDALDQAGGTLAQIAWAAVAIAVVLIVSRWIRGRIRRLMTRRVRNNNLPVLIDNLVKIVVYLVAGAFALGALGTDPNSLVTAFSLATAAISLSLQDILKNFVSGLYLLAEQPFRIGDRIEVSGQIGQVERVDVRITVIRNDHGEQVLIPNFQVFSQVVSNRSAYALLPLTFTLSGMATAPDEAEPAATEAIAGVEGVAAAAPRIDLLKAGPDGCDLGFTLWRTPGADPRREIARRLRARFPEATLTISP